MGLEQSNAVPNELTDHVYGSRNGVNIYILGMELYSPVEFKATSLMVGNPNSRTALCTSWADPWDILHDTTSANDFSIAGPLRTGSGVEVMLVNLARHPQIDRVVIWAGGKLDDTAEANLPRNLLMAFFERGIDGQGKIVGTDFKLNPSLVGSEEGLGALRKIRGNVELVGPVKTIEEAAGIAKQSSGSSEAYMSPYKFEPLKIVSPDTLPSEGVGLSVRESDMYSAWLRLMDRIIRYGKNVQLETNGARVRELKFVRVIFDKRPVEVPDWILGLERVNFSPEALEKYYQEKIKPDVWLREIYPGVERFERPGNMAYLYSQEMNAFPRDAAFDAAVQRIAELGGAGAVVEFLRSIARYPRSDAAEITSTLLRDPDIDPKKMVEALLELYTPPVNQMAKIIERIRKMPDDADKVFVVWQPGVHGMRDRGRPCMIQGSMLIRDGKMHMKVVYRSHDVGKGWLENVYGMRRLLEDMATETGYEPGQLVVDSESGHIYMNDVEWVQDVVAKEIWAAKPEKRFIKEDMADPRGNWLVALAEGKIVLTLRDPVNSQMMLTLEGRTAKDVMSQLRQLKLVEQADHALDIGMQLANAEVSRLTGTPFTQDKPVDFRRLAK